MSTVDLATVTLTSGAHDSRDSGVCFMELVAWMAGEPHSDNPSCSCPVLAAFLRSWNDSLDDSTRQRLKFYAPRVIGTNDGKTEARAWMCVDWLIREYTPSWLDLATLTSEADVLRSLPVISGPQTLAHAT